jgi:hypothetical protein
MDRLTNLLNPQQTPEKRISFLQRGQMPTCVVNIQPNVATRRGPDDYTPVNLRHEIEEDYKYVEQYLVVKKEN